MAAPAEVDVLRAWRFPIVAVAVCAIAGDALALRYAAGPMSALAAGGGVVLLVAVRRAAWRWGAVALIGFVVAHARADLAYRPLTASGDIAGLDLPGTYELAGTIARAPERRDGGLRLVVDVGAVRGRGRSGPAHGKVLLQVRHAERPWMQGDEIRGWLRLRRPRNFGNPGEFDYERHLARRAIRVTAFLYRDAEVERRAAQERSIRAAWRSGVAELFARRAGGDEGRLLAALVLGMGASLPAALRESFAQAGVSHILAVSGLHVGFVAAVAYGGIRWLLTRSEWLMLRFVVPRLAAALTLVPVLLYAGIAGSNVATGRAVLMASLVFGSVLVDRQRNLAVALALAAVAAIALTPGVTADVSFQLSFAAVAALLVAIERFQRWWPEWEEATLLRLQPRRAWLLRLLATYAVVSAAALIATSPLVAYHVNRVSLAAPIANLLVTPILGSLVVPLGLTAALAYPLSETFAGGLVGAASPLISLSVYLVQGIAAVPGSSFRTTTPGWWMLGALYLAGAMVLLGGRRARRAGLAIACAGLALPGVGHLGAWLGPRELRVTFLSVGQGDGAVVELPGGGVMVIDGGGLANSTFDVGERVVAPYLWQRGIARVDVLVVSHPDWDHFGGLRFLAENFRPREVWVGDGGVDTASWRQFAAAVEGSGAAWVPVRRGDRWDLGGVDFRVLWPPVGAGDLRPNDRSVVMMVEYAGERILLPGDAEARSEAALVALEGTRLQSRILKAPHHGSATSSSPAFIDAVAAETVVVSAGSYNRYGLPNRDVLRRYRRAGARIRRTDLHGAVTVTIADDGSVRLSSSAPEGN